MFSAISLRYLAEQEIEFMKKKHPFSPQQSIAEAAYANASEAEQELSSSAQFSFLNENNRRLVSEEQISQPTAAKANSKS
jgi:hypothetical protein